MILLDTNVISEWMKREPELNVIAWLDRQAAAHLFISAVTRAEIEVGIGLLPKGRRKSALTAAAQIVLRDFEQRCLAFDCHCATGYGAILTESRRLGRPMSVEDAQIAAVALRHGFQLATRNVSDFDFLSSLKLVNPWTQTRPTSAH
ncbi:type II toxin-antitoxin system VapC family toxin [uncultured Thiodictyon sp.]|uniref:type II toxin-antitoxin system VapC family toxin n=1 Tax=uncultured Thiodictyon sp. TaxID=1846217 RepID=UPI0025F0C27B|nr:type II toxin-antitoxin system VapC family toxin [uncultured Thiodictyon sp.]